MLYSLLMVYTHKSKCPPVTKYSMFRPISYKHGHWTCFSERLDWILNSVWYLRMLISLSKYSLKTIVPDDGHLFFVIFFFTVVIKVIRSYCFSIQLVQVIDVSIGNWTFSFNYFGFKHDSLLNLPVHHIFYPKIFPRNKHFTKPIWNLKLFYSLLMV